MARELRLVFVASLLLTLLGLCSLSLSKVFYVLSLWCFCSSGVQCTVFQLSFCSFIYASLNPFSLSLCCWLDLLSFFVCCCWCCLYNETLLDQSLEWKEQKKMRMSVLFAWGQIIFETWYMHISGCIRLGIWCFSDWFSSLPFWLALEL